MREHGGYVYDSSNQVWKWIPGPGGHVRIPDTQKWKWIPEPDNNAHDPEPDNNTRDLEPIAPEPIAHVG